MVSCAICMGSIGTPGIEVTYLHCNKCGLDFCGKSCAERHLCGYTKSSRAMVNSEWGYFGMAICFGIITMIVWLLPSLFEDYVADPVITWPYTFIPMGIALLLVGLGLIEKRKKLQKIAKLDLNAPPCPICANKTRFTTHYMRYYCKHCGGYL